jgi:hypothetical protein
VAFVQKHAGRARLLPPATMELQLDSHPDLAQRLQEAQCLLHGLGAE